MFHKVLFSSSAHGTTAGLVVDSTKVNPRDKSAVSRLFPWSEVPKMRTFHVSPAFPTWDEAFAHVFPIDVMGNPKA